MYNTVGPPHVKVALERAIFVPALPPRPAGFVPAERRSIEPLICPPQDVEPAAVCAISVIDLTFFEHERAHPRHFPKEGSPVDAAHSGMAVGLGRHRAGERRLLLEIVPVALILLGLGKSNEEIIVEVASKRRCPGERPARALFMRFDLLERRARYRPHHHAVMGKM